MNLRIIALLFFSLLITSCATNVKEPQQDLPSVEQQAWDELPIDNRTDEEFFNSVD